MIGTALTFSRKAAALLSTARNIQSQWENFSAADRKVLQPYYDEFATTRERLTLAWQQKKGPANASPRDKVEQLLEDPRDLEDVQEVESVGLAGAIKDFTLSVRRLKDAIDDVRRGVRPVPLSSIEEAPPDDVLRPTFGGETCESCDRESSLRGPYCTYCGSPYARPKTCTGCGHTTTTAGRFCSGCGRTYESG